MISNKSLFYPGQRQRQIEKDNIVSAKQLRQVWHAEDRKSRTSIAISLKQTSCRWPVAKAWCKAREDCLTRFVDRCTFETHAKVLVVYNLHNENDVSTGGWVKGIRCSVGVVSSVDPA